VIRARVSELERVEQRWLRGIGGGAQGAHELRRGRGGAAVLGLLVVVVRHLRRRIGSKSGGTITDGRGASADTWTGGRGVLWAISAASVVSRTLANDVGFHRDRAGGAVQLVVQTAAKTFTRLETVIKKCQTLTDVRIANRLALVVLPPERSRSSVAVVTLRSD
jgi:hypothetical protein